MTSLKQGAIMVLNSVLSGNNQPFEQLITIAFDSKATEHSCTKRADLARMEKVITDLRADGSTDFDKVFGKLFDLIHRSQAETELTVIFFTDGEDTCNNGVYLQNHLQQLSKQLKEKLKSSRFMAIGFSDDHDAVFMNKIAQAGSQIGNFIYINSQSENKQQDILNALEESLAIAIEGSSAFSLEVMNISSGFSMTVPIVDQEDDDFVELNCDFIVESQHLQQDLRLVLRRGDQLIHLDGFEQQQVEPEATERLEASIKSANLQIFKAVQKLQALSRD